jgi:hypothetical protein
MRRYLFWALVYELALDARLARGGQAGSGRHRTVFEVAGRRLTPDEGRQTWRLLAHYRHGPGQGLITLALAGMFRLRVTAPLAWASRHPESLRAIFGLR